MKKWCIVAALVLTCPTRALGGGFYRPVGIGARASGMSGSFTSVADDASAVYHNPAGLVRLGGLDFEAGTEILFVVRAYDPPNAPEEQASAVPFPLAYVFVAGAFPVGPLERMALGFGIYDAYGGAVDFPDRPITEGAVKTKLGLYEFVPALAYRIDDRVQVGVGLRVGLGFFSATMGCGDLLSCNQGRTAAEFSTVDTLYGVGFGYSLGILVEPVSGLTLGATYRSNVDVTVKGTRALHAGGGRYDASVFLPFPQQFSLGVAYRINEKWLISAQWDWTDNSRFQKLVVDTGSLGLPPSLVETPCDWKDSHTVRVGAAFAVHPRVTLRWGVLYDSRAIPARTMRRDLQDADNLGIDVGATVHLGKWRLSASVDVLVGDLATGFAPVETPPGAVSPGDFPFGGNFSANLAAGALF